jgi:hypothetical protein
VTLRPNVERLLHHRETIAAAERDLRTAALCLQRLRAAKPDMAAVWLVEAQRYSERAWQRLDEGGEK